MLRSRILRHHRRTLAAAACLAVLAACGGGSTVQIGEPPSGPEITGQVSMPNGQVSSAPSLIGRLAQAVVARVEALVAGNVEPVGSGVEVRLYRIDSSSVVDGQLRLGSPVSRTTTNASGRYGVRLPARTDENTCRFLLEVGSNAQRSITRALVYAREVDVNFESETTLRLLLEQIDAGVVSLCDINSDDIRLVNDAVVASTRPVFGESAAAINGSALVVAGADPTVQAAVEAAVGVPTPVPPATETRTPRATATRTSARPTVTSGVPPTRTQTSAPTVTGGPPTRTFTTGPTATITVVGATATQTSGAANTPTPTNTGGVTQTSGPTGTATVAAATATSTAVSTTQVPTGTATQAAATPTNTTAAVSTPTSTSTATATATVPSATPQLSLGLLAAAAGGTVSMPVTLITNGAQIAAVSNDIEYDADDVDVASGTSGPDCTIDNRLTGSKELVATVTSLSAGRKRLRVGIVGTDNNDTISSGPVYSCRFVVALGAPAAVVLDNTPDAADPQANPVAIAGNDGRIDVTAPLASLGLSAGTVAAGGGVTVTAVLNARGSALAAISTDIAFDPDQLAPVDADENGSPDCTVLPAIAALGKTVFATELAGGEQSVLRVGLIGTDNNAALPDTGQVPLFECQFDVQASGTTIELAHTPEGAGPDAQAVALLGEPGTITAP